MESDLEQNASENEVTQDKLEEDKVRNVAAVDDDSRDVHDGTGDEEDEFISCDEEDENSTELPVTRDSEDVDQHETVQSESSLVCSSSNSISSNKANSDQCEESQDRQLESPDNSVPSLDQGGKSPDQDEESPDYHSESPDHHSGSLDQHRKSPDHYSKCPDHHSECPDQCVKGFEIVGNSSSIDCITKGEEHLLKKTSVMSNDPSSDTAATDMSITVNHVTCQGAARDSHKIHEEAMHVADSSESSCKNAINEASSIPHDGSLCALIESGFGEEVERSDESEEDEFLDSRSRISSRIQSIDEGFAEVLHTIRDVGCVGTVKRMSISSGVMDSSLSQGISSQAIIQDSHKLPLRETECNNASVHNDTKDNHDFPHKDMEGNRESVMKSLEMVALVGSPAVKVVAASEESSRGNMVVEPSENSALVGSPAVEVVAASEDCSRVNVVEPKLSSVRPSAVGVITSGILSTYEKSATSSSLSDHNFHTDVTATSNNITVQASTARNILHDVTLETIVAAAESQYKSLQHGVALERYQESSQSGPPVATASDSSPFVATDLGKKDLEKSSSHPQLETDSINVLQPTVLIDAEHLNLNNISMLVTSPPNDSTQDHQQLASQMEPELEQSPTRPSLQTLDDSTHDLQQLTSPILDQSLTTSSLEPLEDTTQDLPELSSQTPDHIPARSETQPSFPASTLEASTALSISEPASAVPSNSSDVPREEAKNDIYDNMHSEVLTLSSDSEPVLVIPSNIPDVPKEEAGNDTCNHTSAEESSVHGMVPQKSLLSVTTDESGTAGSFQTLPEHEQMLPSQGVIPLNSVNHENSCFPYESSDTNSDSISNHPFIDNNNTKYKLANIQETLNSVSYNGNYDIVEEDEDRVSDDSLGDGSTVLNDVDSFGSGPNDSYNSLGDGSTVLIEADSFDSGPSDSLDEDSDEDLCVGIPRDGPRNVEDVPGHVNVQQAKLRASLSWLLSKVYGSHVPKELQDPFYENAEGQLVLRPVMVNLLSSSELYCQACSNMFPETHTQWKGHWSIIQVLSRKGIYISDAHESAVTETVLVQTAPFRLKAHLALMDALMRAYICEVSSIEKVVKAVRRIMPFPASSELPGTPEEALIFWVNKICLVWGTEGVNKGRTLEVMEGMIGQKARSLSKAPFPAEAMPVPVLNDLMRDIGDGCSIAAVIAYYRPHLLNIKDLCLKEGIGMADSLYNLQQVRRFCRSYLPWKRFHLTYEDLLYAPEVLRVNIVAFLADLFFFFECTDNQAEGSAVASERSSNEKLDVGKKSWQSSPSNIGAITKRNFNRQSSEEAAGGHGTSIHKPLLSRRIPGRHCVPQEEGGTSATSPSTRQRGSRRALSLSTARDREIVEKSLLAWQDDQRLAHRSSDPEGGSSSSSRSEHPSNSSFNQRLSTNRNANNSLSLDLGSLNTSAHSVIRAPTSDQILEPLLPAVLKPTKEKEMNLSKEEERGDGSQRRKKFQPSTETQPQQQHRQQWPENDLASLDVAGEVLHPMPRPQPKSPSARPYKAFVSGPDLNMDFMMETDPRRLSSGDVSPPNSGRAFSTAGSYTVENRASSAQAARAAGIPVVAESEDSVLMADRSREGSIASSGEYSDHESRKIQQEYKVRESGPTTKSDGTKAAETNGVKQQPIILISDHLSKVTSPVDIDDGMLTKTPPTITNFAELKRLKDKLGYDFDKVDKTALIYMQSGSHGGPYDKTSGFDLKAAFNTKQGQNQEKNNSVSQRTEVLTPVPDNSAVEEKEADQSSADMHQLRLKLEQKRKDIQRKKYRQEAQQNKMRQQLGKAAFMRVVTKRLDRADEEEISDSEEATSSEKLSTLALIGLNSPSQKPSGSPRSQSPAHPQSGLAQNSVIPSDAPTQRLTDWRTQKQLSKGGGGSISTMNLSSEQQQQLASSHSGAVGSGNTGLNYTSPSSSGNKAFSRENIQQTIDNVKHKWFSTDNDLIAGGLEGAEVDDLDGGSFRLHHDDLTAWGGDRSVRDRSQTPVRSHSQSPLHGTSVGPVPNVEYQEYDSSLDKLNSSLTELQGEIMRLSLQHEQLKAAQSPVNPMAAGFPGSSGLPLGQTRPIHGIPKQGPYIQGTTMKQGVPQQPQQLETTTSVPHQNYSDSNLSAHAGEALQDTIKQDYENTSLPDQTTAESEEVMNNSSDGFFVAFGDSTTVKSLKPKLTDRRMRGASPAPSSTPAVGQAQTPPVVTIITEAAGVSSDVAANLAGQAIVAPVTPQKNDQQKDGASPNLGFVIKEESAVAKENANEDEMNKKRIKLMEMQRKRKEEQEKKRQEKEAEAAKKQEEKMIKEEEQERKKAEEKARREQIFQQYLQKKQEEEESPVKPTPRKRDGSANKQRPKSMFIKSKATTPDSGLLALDSGSSSQEDLVVRANMSGRSTPGVISAMRSAYHFRLPQPGAIRKAVSCNTLQGTANGSSTSRRPPSPDLARIKQSRLKGSSQEISNEAASVCIPGLEYAGPKLFVKPSGKSNRHIIVNAISHCCLAGSVNTEFKNKVLEEMSKCDANHFLILFRDASCQYRGLFIFYPETEEAFKVHGVGPKHLTNEMCEKFYKYNSGAKSFSEITSTKHLSVSVDAVVLHTSVWKSGKAVVKR